MITEKSVLEKPSFIEIEKFEDKIILYDYLLEQRYVISSIALEIFNLIDGDRTIGEIAENISKKYNESFDNVVEDVISLATKFIRSKGLLLKGTVKYNLLKEYYKLIFIK